MNNLDSKRQIIALDLKSFFAYCECLERNLDPYKVPLIVCSNQKGAMTLAISPYLRNLGIKSRSRIYELPKNIRYLKVPPQMGLYAKKSKEVVNVYLEYFSKEDIFVYSIDEVFIDVTGYFNLYQKTAEELALMLIKKVKEKTGLCACAGIGPNVFLAKIAMDLEAKKNHNNIAIWTYDDVKTKLWEVSPLSKIWGIGPRMEKNLNNLGISTIGELALFNKNVLKDKFGILGIQLWNNVNGIDDTTINDLNKEPKNRSISHSQVLFKDYNGNNIQIIILETIDLLTKRLRDSKKTANTIYFKVNYSKSVSGGFKKRVKLDKNTKDSKDIFKVCMNIFDQFYEGMPIRQIAIQLSGLADDIGEQLSLFETYEEIITINKGNEAIDKIKNKYGANSLLRASCLLEDSTIISRNKKNGL